MKHVLLTGFEPFDAFKINPAQQIVAALDGQTVGGAQIVGLILPVVFGEDTVRVFSAIADLQPALVLSLGLAAGTPCQNVERFAINLRRSDDGSFEERIVADGPAAYFATIAVDKVGPAIARAGVPVQPHAYAGNYLCNHIFYHVLHHAATRGLPYQAGFIHLPQSSEQAVSEHRMPMPSLPLDTMIAGVHAAIAEALADIQAE